MAKNSMNDWSTTPASNTDIAGTNINVGCPPQDVGTFMRTVMAQVAYAVQGSGGAIPATWNVGTLIATTGTFSTLAGTLTGALTGTLTGAIVGTTTNDNAAAGDVGEYHESVVPIGSAVSLTNSISANITSLSLTAGDWDVWGTADFSISVSANSIAGWINTTSATQPAAPNGATIVQTLSAGGFGGASPTGFAVGMTRISIASTTTVYLSANASFGSGTITAFGFIGARRVR